ncbi:MAG: hypothetical protein HYZ58_02270 [Acidobacteria bacterium]|nr:hypothetical protein [Acidobacteriota bacterium]MBI3261957.1 hypothetical protein [Acidobacteriota bacterium]
MSLLKPIRLGLRVLSRYPGMTAVSVLALALGIGLTTTMFSIVYGAMLKGLPFDEPDRIVLVQRNNLAEGLRQMDVSLHDYVDWQRDQLTLGLVLATFLSRSLAILLFQVEPRDTSIFSTIVVVLVATGLAACLVPARRASHIDPMIALRYE